MNELLIVLALIVVGFFAGRNAEKKHFASITSREAALINLPIITCHKFLVPADVSDQLLVCGECAISEDYFKMVISRMKNFFGGRLSEYESLVDRARREATLRMKEAAYEWGADIVANVRIETSSINGEASDSNRRGSTTSIEVLAYGTALRYGTPKSAGA